jgi:hypothetical protein
VSAGSFVNAGLQLGIQSVAIAPVKRRLFNIVNFDGSVQGDIIAQATIEEQHQDEMEITQHPVETGAPITDHAFVRPSHLVLTLMWSNSPPVSQSLTNPLANAADSLTNAAIANSSVLNAVAGATREAQAALSYTSTQQGTGTDSVNAAYALLLGLMQQRALFSVITGKRQYKNMICKSLRTGTNFKSANAMTITVECQQVFLVNTTVTALPASVQANPQDTASLQTNGTKALTPAAAGAGVLP